jgi:hypothetical protein
VEAKAKDREPRKEGTDLRGARGTEATQQGKGRQHTRMRDASMSDTAACLCRCRSNRQTASCSSQHGATAAETARSCSTPGRTTVNSRPLPLSTPWPQTGARRPHAVRRMHEPSSLPARSDKRTELEDKNQQEPAPLRKRVSRQIPLRRLNGRMLRPSGWRDTEHIVAHNRLEQTRTCCINMMLSKNVNEIARHE